MGNTAAMPMQRAAPFAPNLTHQQRVTRLYRQALRTSRDWCVDIELWLQHARTIQQEFRANKDVPLLEGERLAQRGLERLLDYRSPEPLTRPYMPGGCTYQRNVPPPLELCEPPESLHAGESTRRIPG